MKKISDSLVALGQYYGIIHVSGVNAAAFLQGQLSANIQTLSPGSYQLSAFCNLKGRIRALLRIWPLEANHYALMLPRSILPQTLKVLADYGRFSKIKLEDASAQYTIGGVLGLIPQALQALSGIQLLALSDTRVPRFIAVTPVDVENDKDFSAVIAENAPMIAARTHSSDNTTPLSQWQALDIRAGIPDIAPQSIELFLPHHLGPTVLSAISFDKGCFCGQEVIARMHYRSTPKKQLAYLQAAAYQGPLPAPGTKLYAEPESSESIGAMVQAVHLEQLEALITIQKNNLSIDRLYLEAASGERVVILIESLNGF